MSDIQAVDLLDIVEPDTPQQVLEALVMIVRFGGIDGDHHKAWVLDQVTRLLAGARYDALVTWAKSGEDGPDTYAWDEGIAP